MSEPGVVEWHGPPPRRTSSPWRMLLALPLLVFLGVSFWMRLRQDGLSFLSLLLLLAVVVGFAWTLVSEWRRRGERTQVIASPRGLTVRVPRRRPIEDLPWSRIERFVVDDTVFLGVRPGLLTADLTDGRRLFVGLPEAHEGLLRYWRAAVENDDDHDRDAPPPASA